MKMYIVQKRQWELDDDYFVLADTIPLKAFTKREDAEAFHILQVLMEQVDRTTRTCSFLGEDGLCDPGIYPQFEIVEAELRG